MLSSKNVGLYVISLSNRVQIKDLIKGLDNIQVLVISYRRCVCFTRLHALYHYITI